MSTPDETLTDFLKVLNNVLSPTIYHNVNYLMDKVFCGDDPQNKIPSVGITDHGPQFIGQQQVSDLFQQLFRSFPDLALTPLPGAPRLYSPGDYLPKTIGIQVTLTGTHLERWFQRPNPHFSPPLSDIHPDKLQFMSVPACAVFSFDDDGCLMHLAIYLDRYRMAQQLTPASASSEAGSVRTAHGKRVTITIDEG